NAPRGHCLGSPPGPGRPTHSATATQHRKRDPTTVTALTLSTSAAPGLRADAIVIGVAKGAKGPVVAPGAEAVDTAYDGKLAGVREPPGAAGPEGDPTKLPAPAGFKSPLVLAVGLGGVPDGDAGYDAEALRRAAGLAARTLNGVKKAGFALPVEDAAAVGAI